MQEGLIIKGIGGFYYVFGGGMILECRARGIFRKDGVTPLPGDYVRVEDLGGGEGNVQEIYPRKNELVRPAVANVDCALIVVSAKAPLPDWMLLDKLLVTVEGKGIAPVIIVNKEDLDEEGIGESIASVYGRAGYPVRKVSALNGEGLQGLMADLEGKITVFAGQSGVGKSTLINMMMQSQLMKTGDVSAKIERGRHTTRHAELIPLQNGGFIADTPGFSSFSLMEIESCDLQKHFPEFLKVQGKCKFNGCIHVAEPECSVKEAVSSGDIDRGRFERYCEMVQALKAVEKDKYKKR